MQISTRSPIAEPTLTGLNGEAFPLARNPGLIKGHVPASELPSVTSVPFSTLSKIHANQLLLILAHVG